MSSSRHGTAQHNSTARSSGTWHRTIPLTMELPLYSLPKATATAAKAQGIDDLERCDAPAHSMLTCNNRRPFPLGPQLLSAATSGTFNNRRQHVQQLTHRLLEGCKQGAWETALLLSAVQLAQLRGCCTQCDYCCCCYCCRFFAAGQPFTWLRAHGLRRVSDAINAGLEDAPALATALDATHSQGMAYALWRSGCIVSITLRWCWL